MYFTIPGGKNEDIPFVDLLDFAGFSSGSRNAAYDTRRSRSG
jgi:hypothetical protein